MLIHTHASLRYRHWLVASVGLFALGTAVLLGTIAGAGGEHLSRFETTCVIAALVVVVISLRRLASCPDAPRIRIREVETRVIAGPLFPQRRSRRRAEPHWRPTVWSPDDLTDWSPERDFE